MMGLPVGRPRAATVAYPVGVWTERHSVLDHDADVAARHFDDGRVIGDAAKRGPFRLFDLL